jgi:hypothetical protein
VKSSSVVVPAGISHGYFRRKSFFRAARSYFAQIFSISTSFLEPTTSERFELGAAIAGQERNSVNATDASLPHSSVHHIHFLLVQAVLCSGTRDVGTVQFAA